jgi:ribosomal protein S18 acetylase RimI-like enzyme
VEAIIRQIGLGEVAAWAELAREVFAATYGAAIEAKALGRYLSKAFSEAMLMTELAKPEAYVWGAWMGERLAGFSQVARGETPECVSAQEALEVVRLYVAGAYQGKGVAGQLMTETIKAAAQQGKGSLWLYVWERNERAVRFYRKWGFERVGEADLIFEGVRFHDLILERPFNNFTTENTEYTEKTKGNI